ncbi:hypothetical protein GCM10011521_06010 [Arenimonas soli]|uniref:Uncharacterized protein n=1 Tax=Arenimonas soli TaxID=2269504 RepID=A0ABQ1HCB5_9GAMM|nr:hypothetical protein [Arenimonas soli]GGA70705.1 hypothetical protein GCM10011521_06010 [Arenimonas soli]
MARKLKASDDAAEQGEGLVRMGKARINFLADLEARFDAAAKAGPSASESCRAIAFEAVALCLAAGIPPPAWAADSFVESAEDYFTLKADTLDHAFRTRLRRQREAKRKLLDAYGAFFEVQELERAGIKRYGVKGEESGLEIVAKRRRVSVKTLEANFTRLRRAFENGDAATIQMLRLFTIFKTPRE